MESQKRRVSKLEAKRLDRMYEELKKLEGIVKDPITDASSTIDEVLYGENGAWKGSNDDP